MSEIAGSILRIRNVSKTFGGFQAVSDVSLDIQTGESYALIGSNGAGKTTLVKMITGLYIPNQGTIQVSGYDTTVHPVSAKRNIGYVPDNPTGYDYLSGNEFLSLTARLRGMSAAESERRISEITRLFPISDILPDRMENYSRGNRQKLAFLASILTSPPLLVIDEPVVGLDPESITIFGNAISDHVRHGGTVFFVSHTLWFVQKYASRAGIMDRGRIIKEVPVSPTTKLESYIPHG